MTLRDRDSGGRRGVCLLCGDELDVTTASDVEDDFFTHFADVHQSGEPMYTFLPSETND